MQQSDLLVQTGLGVYDFVEAAETEAECISSLPSIHVVAKSQDYFQQAS